MVCPSESTVSPTTLNVPPNPGVRFWVSPLVAFAPEVGWVYTVVSVPSILMFPLVSDASTLLAPAEMPSSLVRSAPVESAVAVAALPLMFTPVSEVILPFM